MSTNTTHPFQKAGLGEAPFTFTGLTERRGPIRMAGPGGVTIEVGSPGQPMGCCDYCGQGIAICCGVRSADGNEFVVGTDCVEKIAREDNVADNFTRKVKREAGRLRREKQLAREARRIAAARAAYEAGEAAALKDEPHPVREGDSLHDYVGWMFANAGHTGRLKAARLVGRYVDLKA